MSGPVFPILDLYNRTLNIPKCLIEEVRQKFLERVGQNPDSYYGEDIDRVKTDDWTVRRFLYRLNKEPDVSKGLESLDKAMKWRKTFGVLDFKDKDIAQECVLSGGIVHTGTDLNGGQLFIIRGKVGKKSKTWRPYFDQLIIHYMERLDRQNTGKGVTILTDSRDTGLKNVDTDAMKFMQTVLYEYYPGLVNATVVYKMPPVMEAVFKLFKSWLTEEQSKYMYLADKKNLNTFVSVDQLPDFMKGTNTNPYRTPLEGAINLHEAAQKHGIKKEKADKLVKHMEKFFDN